MSHKLPWWHIWFLILRYFCWDIKESRESLSSSYQAKSRLYLVIRGVLITCPLSAMSAWLSIIVFQSIQCTASQPFRLTQSIGGGLDNSQWIAQQETLNCWFLSFVISHPLGLCASRICWTWWKIVEWENDQQRETFGPISVSLFFCSEQKLLPIALSYHFIQRCWETRFQIDHPQSGVGNYLLWKYNTIRILKLLIGAHTDHL